METVAVAEAIPIVYCYCCGDNISIGEKKKRRRLLSTAGLEKSASILISMALDQRTNLDKEKMHNGYVCRSCCGILNKISNLYDQLSSKLETALPILPTKSAVPQVATNSRRRRPHVHSVDPISLSKSPVMVVSFPFIFRSNSN